MRHVKARGEHLKEQTRGRSDGTRRSHRTDEREGRAQVGVRRKCSSKQDHVRVDRGSRAELVEQTRCGGRRGRSGRMLAD